MTKNVTASLDSGRELLVFRSIPKKEENVKSFFISNPLVSKLSSKQRVMLDYMLEEMSPENVIKNDKWFKINFKKRLKQFNLPKITDNTINKYFNIIADTELLYKIDKRGYYQVNPYFFFNGTLLNREKLIRKNLERINKQPINKHRHILLKKLRPEE